MDIEQLKEDRTQEHLDFVGERKIRVDEIKKEQKHENTTIHTNFGDCGACWM